jgi:hypothetical protein
VSGKVSSRQKASYSAALIAFLSLLLAALVLGAVSAWLQGSGLSILSDPLVWLTRLDPDTAASSLSDAAQLVANVVAIAITVVAIVVELAANRYSHRITRIFVTEPINIVVMSMFIITTVQCVWISVTLDSTSVDPLIPNAGYGISMILVALSLLVLLPYFAFVFYFLSPTNIIEKIRLTGGRSIRRAARSDVEPCKRDTLAAVDELQDIARRAAETGDRAVAMASLNALADLLLDYQPLKSGLPEKWFACTSAIVADPDFVSLAPAPLADIELRRTWFEVKIFRQYLSIVTEGGVKSREIINLIAINTRHIGVVSGREDSALLELCMHCFNSYLRATINARDQRSSYYVMNHYRQLAETLLAHNGGERVREIAQRLQFYAVLAYKYGQAFLLEVAAYDIVRLIEQSIEKNPDVVDRLLDLLMDLDQEIKNELQEHSVLGVRRAQIQLATLFMQIGDERRTDFICRDLKTEQPARIRRLCEALADEQNPQYWEITDRGVNFSYLVPDRRRFLGPLLERLFGD